MQRSGSATKSSSISSGPTCVHEVFANRVTKTHFGAVCPGINAWTISSSLRYFRGSRCHALIQQVIDPSSQSPEVESEPCPRHQGPGTIDEDHIHREQPAWTRDLFSGCKWSKCIAESSAMHRRRHDGSAENALLETLLDNTKPSSRLLVTTTTACTSSANDDASTVEHPWSITLQKHIKSRRSSTIRRSASSPFFSSIIFSSVNMWSLNVLLFVSITIAQSSNPTHTTNTTISASTVSNFTAFTTSMVVNLDHIWDVLVGPVTTAKITTTVSPTPVPSTSLIPPPTLRYSLFPAGQQLPPTQKNQSWAFPKSFCEYARANL